MKFLNCIYINLIMRLVSILFFLSLCEAFRWFVDVGSDVPLRCLVYSFDPPPMWTKQNHCVEKPCSEQTIFSNGEWKEFTSSRIEPFDRGNAFIIKSARLNDSGFYTCITNNGSGPRDVTEVIMIDEFCSESFRKFENCVIQSIDNLNLSVSCQNGQEFQFSKSLNELSTNSTRFFNYELNTTNIRNEFVCTFTISDSEKILIVKKWKRYGWNIPSTNQTKKSSRLNREDFSNNSLEKFYKPAIVFTCIIIMIIIASVIAWKNHFQSLVSSQDETKIFFHRV